MDDAARTVAWFEELGAADVARAGGKGANLGELVRAGLPVPPGFVLTTAAYDTFVDVTGLAAELPALAVLGPGEPPERFEEASEVIRRRFVEGGVPMGIVRELTAAYRSLGDRARVESARVAVRSSATAEDLPGASSAGQQESFLEVRGEADLLTAVRRCWASLWTARAMAYRARRGHDRGPVSLAVVVQQMADADAAGVMFTADPVTGLADRIVIAAAWGLGESVVGGSVTPDDVVVARGSGQVLRRVTADKTVETVPVRSGAGGGTTVRPVPVERRTRPVLDDARAAELARLGERIEACFGVPQDVEWVLSGGSFRIVQARPVTALPEPTAEPPTDWTVPRPHDLYFRASIVEQLPDPLTPLFADLIDPAVTRSLLTLFREVLGARAVREGELGLPTVNGYAYYRYSRASLLRATVRTPLAVLRLGPGGRGGLARWRTVAHPAYVQVVREVSDRTARGTADRSDAQLLDDVRTLLDAGAAYYTSVQAVIPAAASSEAIFTWFYERFVRRAQEPPAATFLLGLDSEPIRAEKSLHELARWAREHDPELAGEQWQERLREHLDRFGHAVYNLDFVNPVPADDPAPLLATVRLYLRGEGADPSARQSQLAARCDEATAAVIARLGPVRRSIFVRLSRWARRTAPLREDALADVGLAWPQLRRLLGELGRRLVAAGTVEHPDDVYWLHPDEILAKVPVPPDELARRRSRWRGQRLATPPQLLPRGTVLDRLDWLRRFMPATDATDATGAGGAGRVIRGKGAGGGRVVAPARVLSGPQDFHRMRPGDVLVTAITTPAWTSLFAMASAVVTDIGGPLSHSSIVAREYGIPAVLGTNVATRRIPDGARLLVDGDAGTVTMLDPDDALPGLDRRGPATGG